MWSLSSEWPFTADWFRWWHYKLHWLWWPQSIECTEECGNICVPVSTFLDVTCSLEFSRQHLWMQVVHSYHLRRCPRDWHCVAAGRVCVLASKIEAPVWISPVLLDSAPANSTKKSRRRLKCLGPVTQAGDPNRVPDSWLWPGPALTHVVIGGVRQLMEDLSLSDSLSLSFGLSNQSINLKKRRYSLKHSNIPSFHLIMPK